MREEVSDWFLKLQSKICDELLKQDSELTLISDEWKRPGGGGGLSRILQNGKYLERGGVNFSAVHGETPDFLKKDFNETDRGKDFFATGISIVIHPKNPFIPIIHMNTRYFEMGQAIWFGGGIDLTPHYIFEDDAVFFHRSLKDMCDRFHVTYYPRFKEEADNYFYLNHRSETRGIGGIFFDRIKANDEFTLNQRFEFVKATGELFIPVYSELIKRNQEKEFNENNVKWQRLRRGRYVEFNLVYDKGTKFGLETNGRTESILMSLPPMVQWEYNYKPDSGSPEEKTQKYLKKGIDWIK
jgi:coproporphyrinogen III oxidase